MFAVEVYAAVRQFRVHRGQEPAGGGAGFRSEPGDDAKMCRFSLPPGYQRTKPAGEAEAGALLPVIDAILEADRTAPAKQRHTAKRIFERLRDEHGFAGGYTVVKDYVRIARARARETFVPLAHPPGHAQVDFGEAVGVIGGVRQKLHFFCMDLPLGHRGKREFIQVLRLMETFDQNLVADAVKDALKLGAPSFDAVKQLILCRIEKRPPRLDLAAYPYLPKAAVQSTRAADYTALLDQEAA